MGIAKRGPLRGHVLRGWLAGCLAVLGAGALVAPGAAGAAACPNESLRADSPQLADCRAYEMVSPVDMNGNGIEQAFAVSPDGNKVGYGTINIFGDEAPSSVTGKWIASRGAGDWSTATINPPTLGRVPSAYDEPVAMAFSDDLSTALLGSRYPIDPLDQAPYTNSTNSGDADIYQVWPGGRAEWLSHGPVLPDTENIDSGLSGTSADLSRVLFQSAEQLTPEVAGSSAQNLFERSGAQLRTVNLDENGNLIAGGGATGSGAAAAAAFNSRENVYSGGQNAQGHPYDPSAVSRDGSRVFFTAPLEPDVTPRQLYVRIDGTRTERVSTCHFGSCDEAGAPDGARFLLATPDGSAVIFYSSDQLMAEAAPGGGIYRYEVGTKALSYLAPLETGASSGSPRHGGVLAASEDGSFLYLCEGGDELAVYHAGEVRSIASIPCDADALPNGATLPTPARTLAAVEGVKGITQGEPSVTPDSGYLFATAAGPAEIGNDYPNEGHSEVYFYDASARTLHCVSCRPDGAPAQGDAFLNRSAARIDKPFVSVPSPVLSGVGLRNLSATGGRAFFVSEESLVPDDGDGSQDVYEWEQPGSGSCATASADYVAASGGCLTLISSGDGPEGAVFEGASENGEDAFFASYSSLVPADSGTELQLYDARVDGGLAAQHAVAQPACPDAAGCRGGASAAPPAAPAASAGSSGPGNSRVTAACVSLPQRTKTLRTKAKAARKQASRARNHHKKGRAKQMTRKGRRLTTRAGRLARQAKQCAKGDRGAAK